MLIRLQVSVSYQRECVRSTIPTPNRRGLHVDNLQERLSAAKLRHANTPIGLIYVASAAIPLYMHPNLAFRRQASEMKLP